MRKAKDAILNIRIESETKEFLDKAAEKRGMTTAALARAILTNWVKPHSIKL